MKIMATLAALALAIALGVAAQAPAPTGAPVAAAPGAADPAAPQVVPATASPAAPGAGAPATGPGTPSEAALDAARSGSAELLAAKAGDDEAGAAAAAPCAACHGLDGNSVDPLYPRLAGQSEWFIARQLMLFKTGVRQNALMQPFAVPLTPKQMRDLGAYYAKQPGRSGIADEGVVTAAGPHLGKKMYVVGEQLYRGGDMARGIPACMACHGPAGAGIPGTAFPRLTGQHAGYVEQRLERYRAGEMLGDPEDNPNAPIMPAVAEDLTDLEISALATYVEGLHAFDPKAAVAALTPTAATIKEPDTTGAATTAPGAATQDSAAGPGPGAAASPNAAPQAPASTEGGDPAN